jgi:hypothetical protein
MSWIDWIFGKTDEQKRIECLEDLSKAAFSQIRELEEKLARLQKDLYASEMRSIKLENEKPDTKALEKPKKKAGRPKKEQPK